MEVTGVIIYPIKALKGIQLPACRLNDSGLIYDRVFCVVDSLGIRYPKNTALSMRQFPKLASIGVDFDLNDNIVLTDPTNESNSISFSMKYDSGKGANISVECAGASTTSVEDGAWHLGCVEGVEIPEVSKWLSPILNDIDSPKKRKKEKTVYKIVRAVDKRKVSKFAGVTQTPFTSDVAKQRKGLGSPFKFSSLKVNKTDSVVFHDAFPLNILNLNSFRVLKSDLRERFRGNPELLKAVDQYSYTSFRPNIIIDFAKPWTEETFDSFSIGGLPFTGLKGCPRCTVPARGSDGDWAFPQKGEELAFQKVLRNRFPAKCIDDGWGKAWQGVIFTMHCAYRGEKGRFVKVGDEVVVKSRICNWGEGNRSIANGVISFLNKGFDNPLLVGWSVAGIMLAMLICN